MTKTLFLAALLLLVNGCQFFTMNMNKAPERWVTILDVDTGVPVAGVALVYCDTKKPYFIVSETIVSRNYISGPDGRAHVPRNVHLMAMPGYVLDHFRHPYPPLLNADVYHVRTMESHLKLMGERLQKETNQ